jgi:lysophospholipase L1-like esterase
LKFSWKLPFYATAFAGMLAVSVPVWAAAGNSYQLTCAAKAPRGYTSLVGTRYGKTDYGFDMRPSPETRDGVCTSRQAFYVSVKEPEGNFLVTVTLGNGKEATRTAVKAEARRLMVFPISTVPGQTVERSFVVHTRTPYISATEHVHLKPREIGDLDWDHKLTLEFTGTNASVRTITVKPVQVPTIYIAGDSTVVDQQKAPWASWGQMLPAFFTDKVSVANEAESGETIRSFVGEGRLAKIMSTIQPGDYLLLGFAHNDQKPGRGFVSIPEYKTLVRHYIELARSKGAHPVVFTAIERRVFNSKGKIVNTLAGYPAAIREVAREEHVPVIDLNKMSFPLFEAMGPKGTLKAFVHYPANTFPNQPKPLADNTHFTSYGAFELAKCVVRGIREAKLPIAKDIRKDAVHFDPNHPDPPSVLGLPPDPFVSAKTPYER